MAYRFSHPVPLGTPSLDYGAMEVPAGRVGVTQKGSVWFPPAAGASTFVARWAQDGWQTLRNINVNELARYKAATVRTFSNDYPGVDAALDYAAQVSGKAAPPAVAPAAPAAPTRPSYPSSYVDPTQPSYFYPSGTQPPAAPGAQPPAAPGGSMTDQPWFWPAVGAGAIGLLALVWALTPASAGPKVIIRKATSRFTGF
jgi:hypothetical protein